MNTSVHFHSPFIIKEFSTDFTSMGLVKTMKLNHVALKLDFLCKCFPTFVARFNPRKTSWCCWGHHLYLQRNNFHVDALNFLVQMFRVLWVFKFFLLLFFQTSSAFHLVLTASSKRFKSEHDLNILSSSTFTFSIGSSNNSTEKKSVNNF